MRPFGTVLLAAAMLLAPALAQAQQGKPRRCLMPPEVRAEQDVRHGIFLREATSRCDDKGLTTGLRAKWDAFEKQNAPRFQRAMDKRNKAFQREYGKEWQRIITYADGRLVTYHRHFPVTPGHCENISRLMKSLALGWQVFGEQAATVQNEVIEDYKVC